MVDPEKEVRSEPLGAYPKRRFALKGGLDPPSKIFSVVYTPDFDSLEMAHTNFFSSIRKTAY